MTASSLQVQFDPSSSRFDAPRSQKRLEDDRLLTGTGRYSDDLEFPRQCWLVLVRSPHAHAKISGIDLSAAKAAPGVLAAWAMSDLRTDGIGHIPFPPLFKRADGSPMAAPPRTPLAEGKVFYVGQPVAAIAAETRVQAQDAAELVNLDYEDLPSVVDAKEAITPGAPQVWPEATGNVAAQTEYGDATKVSEAFATAAHVTEIELHNQRVVAMALEPRACTAVFENGRTTLYTQNQTPSGARDLLGAVLNAKPQDFRIVVGDIGGGFGMKTGLTPEDALVCYAARKLGRPVRWRADRSEDFLAAHMGRDQWNKARLALDADGRILALEVETLGNIGAVPVGSSAIIPLQLGPKVQTTVYHVPLAHYRVRAVLTHTMATGAYRGAGRPDANFLMERLMEKAPTETVDIEVDAQGQVTVFSGTQAMGQGLETSYTQLVMEVLGVAAQKVRIVQGDTDRANGVGSVGSRSAFVGGSAVVAAGRRVISEGKVLAAEALEAASADIEFRDGRFRIAGTDRAITLADLAGRQERRLFRVSATETPSTPSWPNGAQVCEVEIDGETGEVTIATIASCDDIGRIINHMIVEGQIHGGVAQGAGQALYEQAVYDRESGQLLTGSLMDYAVPRAGDLPPMHASFDETVPCKTNLLGVKGCGELGTIGAMPAVAPAVLDALGREQLAMPLTAEKVWRALR